MIRTSDGSYALVGETNFGGETHSDVFFVKTETLEQPLQVTPLPIPDSSDSTSPETPGQTSNQTDSTPSDSTPGGNNTKPVANAGQDIVVNEGTLVILDASASSDDNGIVSYTWTFTDGTVKTLTGIKPSYMFSTQGAYTITLNVKDASGNEATDTIVVTVSGDRALPSSSLIGGAVAGIAIVALVAFLLLWRKRRT